MADDKLANAVIKDADVSYKLHLKYMVKPKKRVTDHVPPQSVPTIPKALAVINLSAKDFQPSGTKSCTSASASV